jgi:hypothetical protein
VNGQFALDAGRSCFKNNLWLFAEQGAGVDRAGVGPFGLGVIYTVGLFGAARQLSLSLSL